MRQVGQLGIWRIATVSSSICSSQVPQLASGCALLAAPFAARSTLLAALPCRIFVSQPKEA